MVRLTYKSWNPCQDRSCSVEQSSCHSEKLKAQLIGSCGELGRRSKYFGIWEQGFWHQILFFMRLHDKAMPIPRPKSCISLWIFAMRHVVWAVVVARFRSGRLSQKWSLRWACNWKEYGYALDGLRFTSFLNRLNKTLFVIKLGCGAQLGPMPEMAVLCRSGVWIWQALLVL